MFTFEELERLEDCLIAFDTLSAHQDVSPFQSEGKDAESLYLLVSKAKARLRLKQQEQPAIIEHTDNW